MGSSVSVTNSQEAGQVTMLVVEPDSEAAREVSSLLLAAGGSGLLVRGVSSLAEAKKTWPQDDAVCLAVSLDSAAIDDVQILDSVRESLGAVAVVALIGKSDRALGLEAIQRGADDFVLKTDIAEGQLQHVVDCAIERARYRAISTAATAWWSDAVATLGDGLLVVDRTGHVTAMNPAAAQILGAQGAGIVGPEAPEGIEAIVGRDGSELPPADRPVAQTLASGQSLTGVVIGVRDVIGEVRWMEVGTYPMFALNGRVDGVVVSIHDINERVAAEDATRVHETLLNALGQAIIVTDPDDVVVSWNPAAEHMYGWTAAEAIGQRATKLVPAESADQAASVKKALLSGQSWTGDILVRRRDGRLMCTFLTCTPAFDDRNALTAVIGASTDVSERHSANQTRQALASIVTSTADAVFSKSLDGTILTWNRGAAELYGYAEDEVLGQNVSILSPHDTSGEVAAILAAIADGDTVRSLETVRRRRDGSTVYVSLTVSPVYDEAGTVIGASVIGRDLTDRRRLEEQLAKQGTHDSLTGLPSRVLLEDRIAQALRASKRHGLSVAVLMVGLDELGPINAQHGYLVGDRVLVAVAERLRSAIGPNDTLARLSGNKFVIVCEATVDEASAIADRASAALAPVIELDGVAVNISGSIGIAVSPPVTAKPELLLVAAQAAKNEAKASGRALWRVFDSAREWQATERRLLFDDLTSAVAEQTLHVHYQPVVEINTGRLIGVEALARWRHPDRGWISPAYFVPLAEDTGLVAALDDFVLRQACRDAARLRAGAFLPPDGYVAVNVSARNAGDGSLVERVCEAAADANLPIDFLELEVTETSLMGNALGARTALETLRTLGVGVALDDFGTGYSSLTYLRQLPVTTIKVDRTFIQHMTSRSDDLAITASIIDLGRAVDLRTIAEGVETAEQLSLLHRLGCNAGQGFLWSPALPCDELIALIRQSPLGFQAATPTPSQQWKGRRGAALATNEHGLHRIRELHREGASLATIAAALNAADFRTPSGLRWHNSSVARVLADISIVEREKPHQLRSAWSG
jgi:PAS domain S-box-containing protein/diguanylate cyclase (GGDEF)-like protein